MINTSEILQTVRMITEEKLDIRTITMGISLYSCAHPDKKQLYQNVYDRITTQAKDLVKTGETLEREFGIPIVNKRISVTPASLVAAAISLTACPQRRTASMSMPARVDATLTDEQTRSVVESASGSDAMSARSDAVMPFCTSAV